MGPQGSDQPSLQPWGSRAMSSQTQPRTDWTTDVRFYEYTSAANPEMPGVPLAAIGPASHAAENPTGVAAFDLSEALGLTEPATTPNLLASMAHIRPGESLETQAEATSQLFYVIRGRGQSEFNIRGGESGVLDWATGDVFVLPAAAQVRHAAEEDAALYWVHDAPLLRYLGASVQEPRFRTTHFRAERMQRELDAVASAPGAEQRNRRGILLGNAATPQTLTVTHTLWSLLNVLPAQSWQKPHRHNSVALDLCVAAAPGTYTLIGEQLNDDGTVREGHRADWIPGAAFTTPPGWWHSHHNESDQDAIVLPIQDAGLCTYMRTLDIRFA